MPDRQSLMTDHLACLPKTALHIVFGDARHKRGCNTQGSHVITHRSTNWACWCLTSQIGRDGVLSPEYGRIRPAAAVIV